MKSELEKLISANTTAFDTENLLPGHAERFSAMLPDAGINKKAKNKELRSKGFIRIAALAAVVTLAVMLVNPLFDVEEGEYSQFIEAADYFAWELRNKAENVKALTGLIEPSRRSEVLSDIENLSELNLDHIPEGLMSEEEKIGILFENYRAKSLSLQRIENSISGIFGEQIQTLTP